MCRFFFRIFIAILSIRSGFSNSPSHNIIEECLHQIYYVFDEHPQLMDLDKSHLEILISCMSVKVDTTIQTWKQILGIEKDTLISQNETEKDALIRISQHKTEIDKKDEKYTKLEKLYNREKRNKQVRYCIEQYEEEFDRLEYSAEYNSDTSDREKVFKEDRDKIKNMSFKYVYELQTEKRRQRWEFYLTNPPSDFIDELATDVQAKYTIPEFAVGVAIAFEMLGDDMRDEGVSKLIFKSQRAHFDELNRCVQKAVKILLLGFDFSEKMFSYEEATVRNTNLR